MKAETVTAIICCSVMVLGMLASVVALVFKVGTMNGTIMSFMQRAATDRTEVLTEIGAVKNMLHNHIVGHTGGNP